MNAKNRNEYDMVKRVVGFGSQHLDEITAPVAPKKTLSPGQTLAQQTFLDLMTDETGLVDQIAQTAENQQAGTGAARGGTGTKTTLRAELFSGLRGIKRTAAAIAAANGTPALMKKFRMPYSVSDVTVAARAGAMADAAEAMSDEFVKYYHAETFADDLRALVTAFEQADESKGTGTQTHAGATATFGPLLRQAMTKVKQLDAFIQNFYKNNPTVLGEWKTASHVQRAAKRKKGETTPAVTVSSLAASPVTIDANASSGTNGNGTSNGAHPATATNGNRLPAGV